MQIFLIIEHFQPLWSMGNPIIKGNCWWTVISITSIRTVLLQLKNTSINAQIRKPWRHTMNSAQSVPFIIKSANTVSVKIYNYWLALSSIHKTVQVAVFPQICFPIGWMTTISTHWSTCVSLCWLCFWFVRNYTSIHEGKTSLNLIWIKQKPIDLFHNDWKH